MGVKRQFRAGVARFPDRICVDDGTAALTYRQAGERTERLAAALVAEGCGAGTHCAVLSPNSTAAFLAVMAIYAATAVFVPLNASAPAADIIRACGDCDVRVLFYDSSLEAVAAAVLAEHPAVSLAICLDATPAIAAIPLGTLLARHVDAALPTTVDRAEDIVSIYPTGGSTGRPKRAMHRRRVWEVVAASLRAAVPGVDAPVFLVAPPLTHGAGVLAFAMLEDGVTIILRRGFEAASVFEAIAQHRVTHSFLPPTALYKMLDHPAAATTDMSSLVALFYGAAPTSVDKLKQCIERFGPVMVQLWGQAEAPSVCTCLATEDHLGAEPARSARLASCGRATPFTDVEIMGEDGHLLPSGETGELVVRGDIVMAGYYRNPEATEAVSAHGWHHTGDMGFKDEAGFLHIVGRKSDMIITGGYNVYPADVEQALWAHPAVQECAVIGVPDETWGEAIKAVVELKPGAVADEASLIAWCKQEVGSVKAPKSVELRDLPRNAVGKVDKLALRAPFWRDRARQI